MTIFWVQCFYLYIEISTSNKLYHKSNLNPVRTSFCIDKTSKLKGRCFHICDTSPVHLPAMFQLTTAGFLPRTVEIMTLFLYVVTGPSAIVDFDLPDIILSSAGEGKFLTFSSGLATTIWSHSCLPISLPMLSSPTLLLWARSSCWIWWRERTVLMTLPCTTDIVNQVSLQYQSVALRLWSNGLKVTWPSLLF